MPVFFEDSGEKLTKLPCPADYGDPVLNLTFVSDMVVHRKHYISTHLSFAA
jgi:hypothetical protein